MTIKEYVVSHVVNLIKIKSVVTLALTAAFVILALRGDIAPDQFLAIFTMIIGFYFGTQKDKSETAQAAEAPDEKAAEPAAQENPLVYTPESGTIVYDAVYPANNSVDHTVDEAGGKDGSD